MNRKWRKSTYSTAEGNCIEVASNPVGTVAVRDSKNPSGPVLALSPEDWQTFVASVRAGRYDPT